MIVPLVAGYAADLLLGDPHRWPHPVRAFGYAIHQGTVWLNRGRHRLLRGAVLTVVLCVLTWALFFYGLSFGTAAVGAALLGEVADVTGITFVYRVCAFLPMLGLLAAFLPEIETQMQLRKPPA